MENGRRVLAAALLAAATGRPALAAGPWPRTILMAELKSEAFRGAQPEDTRRSAAGFLGGLDCRIEAYQDNEALSAVELLLSDEGSLLQQAVDWFRLQRLRSSLLDLPEVKTIRENTLHSWTIVFKKGVYKEVLQSLSSAISVKHRLLPYRDPRRKGIWVVLSLRSSQNPQAVVRKLRRQLRKVSWVEAGNDDGNFPGRSWPLQRMISGTLSAPRAI